jgi:mono/diheme cytochrome c family protein
MGGHNWHPMAYSPVSETVFIPTQDLPLPYGDEKDFEFTPGFWNGGIEMELIQLPDDPVVVAEILKSVSGQLIAWDPIGQREIWRYQHAGPWNGGVLATAGNLVFQGSVIGEFAAYDAGSGDRLWQFPAQTGIVAAPISYLVNDQQHVAVAAGWGTIFAMLGGGPTASMGISNRSRILAFRQGGDASLPEIEAPVLAVVPEPPQSDADAAQIAVGKDVYYDRCVYCHGEGVISGGITPDLRHATAETHAIWDAIVLGGALRDNGMPAFGQILSKDDSDAVRSFVIQRARLAYERSPTRQGS